MFNKFQDPSYILHNDKRIKTTITLFLDIVSVQFNAVLPTLNKLREACDIEIIGWTENAGPENEGPQKQDRKMEDKCN